MHKIMEPESKTLRGGEDKVYNVNPIYLKSYFLDG